MRVRVPQPTFAALGFHVKNTTGQRCERAYTSAALLSGETREFAECVVQVIPGRGQIRLILLLYKSLLIQHLNGLKHTQT